MLRIAVPNKGSLSEPASQMLREAGYRQRRDSRELVLVDEANDVEFFFLRPRDIAVYVGSGTVDAGFTGRDLLLDSGAKAIEHLPLGFARSTFRFAAPVAEYQSIAQLDGKRIATSYPLLVLNFLRDQGITPAEVVRLDGAVETAIRLGVADVIADVVETGSTLRAAGLEVFGEPLLSSEAVLIRQPDTDQGALAVVTRRLQGVLTARRFVLMDYDVPSALIDEAAKITPGFESPTVSDMHDSGWKAVRVMVPRDETNVIMDRLYDLGARAVLVTQIIASRI
ncbi:ATP phosphoribosyltransferase [Rarobacter faecitabidus]|uniref:ATP phosphoribosyltransferase n=1 Tax=Rarobacter faecitabidus TaxID=13243 RepID=A0A542ZVJ7_RARFA|nr:ATP phosphoribosyltransferase [Rarobacter faecitabidus]TQL64385.1 ATP phosphoribosyltransferase (homohexameric) [Rarobacter faecitabidus]